MTPIKMMPPIIGLKKGDFIFINSFEKKALDWINISAAMPKTRPEIAIHFMVVKLKSLKGKIIYCVC